ncbi:peptide chain release factor N(5)-glutamine methyltransferase [Chelatococcus sp. SYSU_G07232]|uniref:Release factor glutamine methyltransferase n=1 Tax=Chelatococcus albus TaxID=3047466 RepID=A0ABT7AEN0_9HYPH|nr:peptide chain release factor N(5)-glutamine methyltransferase [Chelatococcus sp. SYSU_G07232]MDJ1157447.1 peptide chain release factor N(5)-glutamine methyltransferase [Chelatococcus sp. SYSU_G07232]
MSRNDALRRLRRAFAAAGIDTPGLDARILLADTLGLPAAALVTEGEQPIGADGAARLAERARRRLAREPVARILGEHEFWGLSFRLSPATLVPRPDTETLVAAVLERLRRQRRTGARLRLLDLGTGTGCILVALLSELPAAVGIGVDRSVEAALTARGNAARNGVGARALFLVGDWGEPLAGGFDVVVSNPPYIESAAIADLDAEVREHDPRLALDGGADGLAAYRAIAADLPRLLAPGGIAALEVGLGQDLAVAALLAGAGLGEGAAIADLSGVPRVVVGQKAH